MRNDNAPRDSLDTWQHLGAVLRRSVLWPSIEKTGPAGLPCGELQGGSAQAEISPKAQSLLERGLGLQAPLLALAVAVTLTGCGGLAELNLLEGRARAAPVAAAEAAAITGGTLPFGGGIIEAARIVEAVRTMNRGAVDAPSSNWCGPQRGR